MITTGASNGRAAGALWIERAHVMGVSLDGMVAQKVALKALESEFTDVVKGVCGGQLLRKQAAFAGD